MEAPRFILEYPDCSRCKIRPNDIRFEADRLPGTFGKAEIEWAAERLVRFFQEKGYWASFTITELLAFYNKNKWDPNLMFFGLMGTWHDDSPFRWVSEESPWQETPVYLGIDGAGNYFITEAFVMKCASKQPVAA